MTIDDYINASRKIIKKDYNKNRIFTIFDSIIPQIRVPVLLKVVYSVNKKIELFEFKNSVYLIYDYNVSDSFYTFNKIFLNAENDFPGLSYCYKLCAERLELLNYLRASSFFVDYYLKYKYHLELILNTKQVRLYTLIQEAFIIAHELVHEIVRTWEISRFEYAKDIVIENQKKNINLSNIEIDTLIAEMFHKTLRIDGMEESNYRSYKRNNESESIVKKTIERKITEIELDNSLIEEIICDQLATKVILGLEIANHETTIRAIQIGILNLRSITELNNMVDVTGNIQPPIYNSTVSHATRLVEFREHFCFTDNKSFYKVLIEDSKKYSYLVGNQVSINSQININQVLENIYYQKNQYSKTISKKILNYIEQSLR